MFPKDRKLSDFFPMFPHVQIWAVLDKGWQKKIEPTEAKNVRCPMCNGDEGYTCLINPKVSGDKYQWGCLKDECIKKNKANKSVENIF